MSKHFYRDIKLIRRCKVCGVEFRPPRFGYRAALRRCYVHRNEYMREQYRLYVSRMSPDKLREFRVMKYMAWRQWTAANVERRRLHALRSYHKRKHLHKGRRHRRTREKPAVVAG